MLISTRADLQAADLRPGLGGTAFRARTPWGEVEARVPLLGRHNVENALCALAISLSLGLDLESAAAGLDGAATSYVRLKVSGATATAGDVRFDNFILSATAVPAPGAVALLGAAGLAGGRRRRA